MATAIPAPIHTLTADEARRAALHAQGLVGSRPRQRPAEAVRTLVGTLGAVQLDTISVLARSHELVPYARLGGVGRDAVEHAYWTHEPRAATTFEYWAHAACVLPVAEWPTFGWRRRLYQERGRDTWRQATPEALDTVRKRLTTEGPLTATELTEPRAAKRGPWWDWSQAKVAVEKLLSYGEVVCVARRGWKRVYDLPERALPEAVLSAPEPDADVARRRLLTLAGGALGVATTADLADYYRLRQTDAARLLPDTELVPVAVTGWTQPAWAHPDTLTVLGDGGPRGRHRTTLLSPFDSLVWERARTARIFGFSHRLEAYVPREKREHGYFAMPLLSGGRLLGRVDPARVDGTLVARRATLDTPRAVEPMARALREAAAWVGCDDVRLEHVVPERLAAPLAEACRALGASGLEA